MYAEKELGFSRNKTWQFVRLAEALDKLPALKESIEKGDITWTKARTLARVATPKTEQDWIEQARLSSNRDLENAVKQAKAVRSGQGNEQPKLLEIPIRHEVPPASVQFTFTLEIEERERLQAIMDGMRKRGNRRSRAELLLAAFDALGDRELSRDNSAPPYQIVIYRCEDCGEAKLPSGERVSPTTVARAACDCRAHRQGEPNRASIPPRVRRAVLARDGHRCAMPGCGGTRFLEVHHRVPREQGGGNEAANLVTLCSACHRLVHERKGANRIAGRLPA